MLAPGVINSAILTLPNKSNSIDPNDPNKVKEGETQLAINREEKSSSMTESLTSGNKDSEPLSSSKKNVDGNNNESEDHKRSEDEEMTPSLNTVKVILFY